MQSARLLPGKCPSKQQVLPFDMSTGTRLLEETAPHLDVFVLFET